MTITVLIFLAIALAMDAFAVSVTNGISIKKIKIRHAITIGLFFGVFQAVMPVVGWLLGGFFTIFLSNFAHWIAFFILLIIGGKMIYESLQSRKENSEIETSFKIFTILILAIATSIDAFAVGISFSFLQIEILFAVIVIGIVTFVLSFIGVMIGKKLGNLFGKCMEILGGVILIFIGVKILLGCYNII
jgi:manganese efflux pump family protein